MNGDNLVENRQSSLREYPGQFKIIRATYHRFFQIEAALSGLSPDDDVVDRAKVDESVEERLKIDLLLEDLGDK